MNRLKCKCFYLVTSISFITPVVLANIQTASTKMTWQEQKNNNVVKQNKDYSCGVSSLATILTYFYKTPVTEEQLLKNIAKTKEKDEIMANFQDLKRVSQIYGFSIETEFTDYDSLKNLKIPAIIYLNYKRNDHFTVIRAIDENNVYLADSSWGNRVLTRQQFEKMWYTINKNGQAQGKFLVIVPQQKDHPVNKDFMKVQKTTFHF